MLRDFSDSSKQNLLELVSQVENEKWSDFTDWMGDRWYDFEDWIGKLDIKNYINDVNSYHKKVIDKNNATKQSIEDIFNNVNTINSTYTSNFLSLKTILQKWEVYIEQMNGIVLPSNGKFDINSMSDNLDGILQEFSLGGLDSSTGKYINYDERTGTYIYHWKEIENLFSKESCDLTKTEYQILLLILSTMIDKDGNIDMENLEKFINSGYTTPSPISESDYHTSFETLLNGHKDSYYYIQNKSYMTDTLKAVTMMYKEISEKTDNNYNNLSILMQSVVENYSVIEWRRNVNGEMKRDWWSGELTVSQDTLNDFNELCKPNINLENVDTKGLDYIVITSNASNKSNVRTATTKDGWITRNDANTDNYSDCTIRIYFNCSGNVNSDMEAIVEYSESILSGYYQELDIEQVILDEVVNITSEIPVVGNVISSAYDVASQTQALESISSGLDGIKSENVSEITNISEKTENKIDGGIHTINTGIGIYTKYKAIEINNERVDKNKEAINEIKTNFSNFSNLGLKYNTMIIKYNHCSYVDDGTGIKVDSSKNCEKTSECDISISDYVFDVELLRTQYNYHKKTQISDGQLCELERQVREYIETGNICKGSLLDNYIIEWK